MNLSTDELFLILKSLRKNKATIAIDNVYTSEEMMNTDNLIEKVISETINRANNIPSK